MLYNCANGSVLNMTTEYYFALTDGELNELCNCNEISEINDPFFDSAISKKKSPSKDEDEDFEIDE